MKHFYAFLLLIISHCILANDSSYSQFLNRISTDKGLSQSAVTKVVKDKLGFIWVGTQMGLNRFDGYQVTHIKGPDDIFEQEIITTLFTDQQGYLWVGTSFSGLFRIDPETLESERYFNGKFNPEDDYYAEVLTITQQDENTLWLGISERLFKLEIGSKKLTEKFQLNTMDDIVRDLLIYSNSLYVATSEGLYKLNLESEDITLVNHTPDGFKGKNINNVKRLHHVPGKGLFVGNVEGLFFIEENKKYHLNHIAPIALLNSLNIWVIEPYDGQFFLGTDKGLYLYNLANDKNTFLLNYENSLFQTSDNNVSNVLYNDDMLWLASNSQGLFNWNLSATAFEHITASAPFNLSNENVWAIYEDIDGFLWIGTDNGLNKVDLGKPNKTTTFNAAKDPKNRKAINYIRAIYPNSESPQFIWVMTDGGLYKVNRAKGEFIEPFYLSESKEIITESWLSGLFVVDNRRVYFFTPKGHFRYDSTTGEISLLKGFSHLDPDLSYSFLGQYKKSNQILFTASGHLYLYDETKDDLSLIYKVKNYQPQSFNVVDSWIIDNNGTLWVAMSGEGLIGLDSETYQIKHKYNVTTGLKTNYIYGLMLDEQNNLWFSSQDGLYKLNQDTLHIEQYGPSEGLLSSEFNGYSYKKLFNGKLAFGSPLGVTYFSPEDSPKILT